jgi:predicted acyltransferase
MTLSPNRYLSLDVFRGLTIAFMIIVNSQGNYDTSYGILLHADWHGWTPTDLVFPTFLFVVGVAMAFSMGRYEAQGESAFLAKVFRRTAIIFLLGYLMYWFPFVDFSDGSLKPISETRIPGVLQRIALCYFFASLIIHYFRGMGALIFSVAALLLYRFLLYWFGDPADPLGLEGNAVLKLDLILFGADHLYAGEGIPFDPEGLLSTLPSIVNVIAGYFAGSFIRQRGATYETVAKLMMTGFLLFALASWWHISFPINKKLWTSTFVLYSVGLDLLILPLLIYWIEIQGRRTGTQFFNVFGKNPLILYLVSELFVILLYSIPFKSGSLYSWIYQNVFQWTGDHLGSLLFSVWVMLSVWGVGYMMDRRRIYIKV